MDVELKNKWLDALRSGNFSQGCGQLVRPAKRGDRQYCCLGVLCEISGFDKKEITSNYMADLEFVAPNGAPMFCTLTQDIKAQFGLDEDLVNKCISWNDHEELTFREIANRLERLL